MKTCLVTVLSLCLAGTGLAAPTRAVSGHLSQRHVAALQDLVRRQADVSLSNSESDALLADLIDDLDPAYGIYRRRPDANLASASDAGDSKSGASDNYGPIGPFSQVNDDVDRLNRDNGDELDSVTYAAGDLSGDIYDRSDEKRQVDLSDEDVPSEIWTRANAAEQDQLLGSLLEGLPLAGLVKREKAAKQDNLLGGVLEALPLAGLVKRAVAAEQKEQRPSRESGQPGGHLRRDAAVKQDGAAKQLFQMILEGLATLQQGTEKVHDKRDSETPGLNGLAGGVGDREGAGLVLDDVLGLLDLDQDGLPVDTKKALNAAPVASDDNPLAANLAVLAGSQKLSAERLAKSLAQGGSSGERVEGRLAKAGAGLAAGKLSQATNSTFVVGQPKPQ